MCVGEVLLKKWKQGNTLFSKIRKDLYVIVVFFLCKLTTFIEFPISSKVFPLHTNNVLVDIPFITQKLVPFSPVSAYVECYEISPSPLLLI